MDVEEESEIPDVHSLEDAPANSVSGGGVDLSVDKLIDKEKKKKKLYDGRRKEAKAFMKRIEALRAKICI
mgnify:CR=1 FL=1